MPEGTRWGLFVPTTYIWDVAQLQEVDVQSPEFKELLVRLYQNINSITLALNIKDSGYYFNQEFVNGQVWFPNPAFNSSTTSDATTRQVFRKVINFGALPDTTTNMVAHNITVTPTFSFTRIYGTATNNTGNEFIPIPYSSASVITDNVELYVDNTYVYITTAADYSSYLTTYVILEYLKF